jgi:nitrite reductase (NADH) large subunit
MIKTSTPEEARSDQWQCSICEHISSGSSPPEFCPVCGAAESLFHAFSPKDGPKVQADIRKLVILGSGIAGLTAAEEARRQSKDVEISLVSREPSLPYFRLNLTRYLAGEVAEKDLIIQPKEWFDDHNILFIHGDAQKIERTGRKVHLRNGQKLSYDRLILTNGAHPFIPSIPGSNREGITVLRTIENARHIIEHARSGAHVICVGGGLLGLETARALQKRGAKVTVVEGFKWLLPKQLPQNAAELLKEHLTGLHMEIECGAQIKEFIGDETLHAMQLEDGRILEADLVVLATGVRPNSYLARDCGLRVQEGVIVDDRLFTSDENILAAGDVSQHQGKVYGIWPASYAQGVIAGTNAIGGHSKFTGVPMTNRIKVLDVEVFSIGQIQTPDASTQIFECREQQNYRAVLCRDGQIVGGVLYGDTGLIPVIQQAVEQGRRIPECVELFEHFPGLKKIPKE